MNKLLSIILLGGCSAEVCLPPAPPIECVPTGLTREVKEPGSYFTPGDSLISHEYKCSQTAGTYIVWRQDDR